MIRAYMMRRIFGNLNYSFAYNLETAEDRKIKSLLSFATKTEGVKRLIIVTNEEERTITKDNLTIEVIPVYKFIMETAIC